MHSHENASGGSQNEENVHVDLTTNGRGIMCLHAFMLIAQEKANPKEVK